MQDPYGLFFGVLFVLVYAYDRFNTPSTNRSSTTWVRYRTSAFLYLASSLLLFLFLAKILEFSPKSATSILPEPVIALLKEPLQSGLNGHGLSYYLLSALCLTILLTKTPGLKHVDDFIRTCFQRCGAIPYQVYRLSADLHDAEFTLPDEQRAALVAERGMNGSQLDERRTGPGAELTRSWLRLHSIRTSLESLRQDRNYVLFFNEFSEIYDDLSQNLGAVDRDASGHMRLHANGPLQVDGLVGEVLESHGLSVQREVEGALERAYLFISRAILTCERTNKARLARIKRLGFALSDSGAVRISYDRMALLLVALTSLIAAVALTSIHLQKAMPEVVLNLRHALQIAIVVWAAILWAVLIKKTGNWARPASEGGTRPYVAYLLAGALAVATQVVVYVVIKVMIVDNPQTVLEHLPRTIPWAPLVFFAAFVTSLQCDSRERPGLRWQEGLAQGAFMAGTAWTAFQISMLHPAWAPTGFADDEAWTYVVGGAVLGFLVGVVVPHWHRADNRSGIVAAGWRGADAPVPISSSEPQGAGILELARQP